MTWRTFADAIHKAQITNEVPWRIINELFMKAGYPSELIEPTVRSWLNGNRNCMVRTYFPNNKIDDKKVFAFFKNRPAEKLWNLQKIFQEAADANSPIDVNTNDLDTFCWSLVNQFLDLLGFQRVDIPHTDTPLEAKDSQLLNNQEEDIPKDTIPDQVRNAVQDAVQQTDGIPPISRADAPEERKHSIRAMFLPHSDDCCYRCAYWNGNRKTFEAYTMPTYGFCLRYNRDKQLSSAMACEDFKKREKQLGEW